MKSSIKENYLRIKETIPDDVTLVAVSKFNPAESILEVYNCGQRVFGESKVQELTGKYAELPKDIQWHFIGHLQTNKVKYIVPFVSLIHSIDSAKLFTEVAKTAAKENKTVDVLLQIHIAEEQTKYGFTPEECFQLLFDGSIKESENIRIRGLMGMATYTDDEVQIRSEFRVLMGLYNKLKESIFKDSDHFDTRSFGMSDDYKIAISEGSDMVRIGSSIFGERNYNA